MHVELHLKAVPLGPHLGLSTDVQALGGNQYRRRFQPTTQTNIEVEVEKRHMIGFIVMFLG